MQDAQGGQVDDNDVNERMWEFQDSLEAMSDVGVVLSPPVLFGHARQQPLARLLPLNVLAGILESDQLGRVGTGFFTRDRLRGRFFARMHELERSGGRFGLQVMCEGGGMANATILERLD